MMLEINKGTMIALHIGRIRKRHAPSTYPSASSTTYGRL
jgi:hypothetical protein